MTAWPFFPRNPTPWTDYLAACLMTWYATMYIIASIGPRIAPKTWAWAERKVAAARH